MFDFFDSGIMEALEYRLVKLTKIRTAGDVTDTSGKSLALTSQVRKARPFPRPLPPPVRGRF